MVVVKARLAVKVKVPAVRVILPVHVKSVPAIVVVPVWLIVIEIIVREFPVIVPVSTMLAVKPVNVPPGDNVSDSRFNDVVGNVKTVVSKLNVLNQLPVVIVTTAVPLPFIAKLGLLATAPPVVPKTKVLVTAASLIKLPVPV